MALPPPPNHPQRQAVASTLLQGVRLCIDAAVANREKLCKLLSEHGACISEEPEEDAVHVLESFCGELFDELRRRGARIVGPPCIYESVRCGKPLPDSKYPIYSRVLEGLCITTTGFHARRKSDVEALIRFMGGVYLPDLTNRTHYLVASEVGSEKYFVACQRSIPIVRIEWLLSCWKESAFLTPHDFILSPLAGLTICVTGLSAASRAVVQRLVCQHGGRYSADLTRKCTHLLAYSCEGNKFHYASFWGIPVIRPEWLAECINVGIYVDPRPFLLTPHAPPTPHTPTVPPQIAALSLPDLPSLPAPLSKSRARAHTLSSLSRSQSTTALEVISDAAAPPPAILSADVPRAPHITAVKKRPANTRLVISSSRDLRALLADCDAAVESVLNVSTVCALLLRASPQAHPSLWQACVAFAAEHLEELQAQPAFASLPTEVRDCINHTRRAGGEKRRRVGDE